LLPLEAAESTRRCCARDDARRVLEQAAAELPDQGQPWLLFLDAVYDKNEGEREHALERLDEVLGREAAAIPRAVSAVLAVKLYIELGRQALADGRAVRSGDNLERALRTPLAVAGMADDLRSAAERLRNLAVASMGAAISDLSDLPDPEKRLELAADVMRTGLHEGAGEAMRDKGAQEAAGELAERFWFLRRFREAAEWSAIHAEMISPSSRLGMANHLRYLEDALEWAVQAKDYQTALGLVDRLEQLTEDYPDEFAQPYADRYLQRRRAAIKAEQMAGPETEKPPIELILDKTVVPVSPSPEPADGDVLVPPGVVAEYAGGTAHWDPASRTATVSPPSPWTVLPPAPREPPLSPYDFAILGPLLCLRQALSDEQWESLNRPPDSTEPILARFEITDAHDLDLADLDAAKDEHGAPGREGFAIRALLYWAFFDADDPVPPGAARIVRQDHPDGKPAGKVWHQGAWPKELRIEAREYVVKPKDATAQPRAGGGEEIVRGASGWTIDEDMTHVLSTRTVSVGEVNHVLSLYDLSIQKVKDPSKGYLNPTAAGEPAKEEARGEEGPGPERAPEPDQDAAPQLVINGVPILTEPGPRFVDGEALVASKPLAKGLDLGSLWNPKSRQVIFRLREPWLTLPLPLMAFSMDPYNPVDLGPVLTLRHALSELQRRSLEQGMRTREPVLVRFEITDARDVDLYDPGDFSYGMKGRGGAGFGVRAILYWAIFDPDDPVSPQEARIIRPETDGGGTNGTAWVRGAWPRAVRIESLEYTIVPNGVSEPRKIEAGQEMLQGTSGWTIEEKTTELAPTRTVEVGEENHVVPLFDISLQSVKDPSEGYAREPVVPPPTTPADLQRIEQYLRETMNHLMEGATRLSDTSVDRLVSSTKYPQYEYSVRGGLRHWGR
jgi:tetratricopeptide (TPR) repeat protein